LSKYIHKSHNVSVLIYHFVCPAKYRKVIFNKEVDDTLKGICLEISNRFVILVMSPRSVGTTEELLEIIRSTTGWETTWFELMKLGERSINMAVSLTIEKGLLPKMILYPKYFSGTLKVVL